MVKFFNNINKGFSRIFRIFLFAFSAFLIIYFFPKSGKFKYNYENGRPWQSENLYAPFDFAINKTKKEIDLEIDQLKLSTPLFFEKDTSLIELAEKSINFEYDKLYNNKSIFRLIKKRDLKPIKANSLKIINEVYNIGYLGTDYDFNDYQKISILSGNRVIDSTSFYKLINDSNGFTDKNNLDQNSCILQIL